MVVKNTIGILALPQREFNRQIYRLLLEVKENGDTTALNTAIKALEDEIGKSTGTGAGGILKDIKDIKDAIGSESTEGSILYRLKTLEE